MRTGRKHTRDHNAIFHHSRCPGGAAVVLMGAIHQAIADMLAGELEQRASRWDDELPGIYAVVLRDDTPHLGQVHVPERFWYASGSGAEGLEMIAAHMARSAGWQSKLLPCLVPEAPAKFVTVYAMAYRGQACAVIGGAARAAQVVRERPEDLIPCHLFAAVDRAGIRYGATLLRGQERADREVIYPHPAGQDGPDAQGMVIESLAVMIDSIGQLAGGWS